MNSSWRFRLNRGPCHFPGYRWLCVEEDFTHYFSPFKWEKHGRTAHMRCPAAGTPAQLVCVLLHSLQPFLHVKALDLTTLQSLQPQTCAPLPLSPEEMVSFVPGVCHLLYGTRLSWIWLMFPIVDILSLSSHMASWPSLRVQALPHLFWFRVTDVS